MVVFNTEPDVERELIRAGRALCRANVFFLVNLAEIVGVTTLREGDKDDYFIDVPASRFHEIDRRITDLEESVRQRFGTEVTAGVIPVPD